MSTEEEELVIEGWMMVCEGMSSGSSGHLGGSSLEWHPGYCIARGDEKSLICYKWEPSDIRYRPSQVRVRLDGGRGLFSNYWNVYAKVCPKRPSSGFHTMSRCTLRTLREENNLSTDQLPKELKKGSDRLPKGFGTVRIRKSQFKDCCNVSGNIG